MARTADGSAAGPSDLRLDREPAADGARDPRIPLALAGAVACVALAAVLIRLAQPLDALVIAALRIAFTALAWCAIARGDALRALRAAASEPRVALALALGAAAMAAHFGLWTASVVHTSVARATLLVSMAPLFAGLVGRVLGDSCPPRFWLGTAVALAGAALLATGDATGDATGEARGALASSFGAGEACALGAAACAALYLAAGRSLRRALPLTGYLALLHVSAAAMLAAATLAAGSAWRPSGASARDYAAVAVLALLAGVGGHGLQNWAVRRVPVHVVSLALLLEPLVAAALAWLVLDERVGVGDAVGGAVLLAGIALALGRSLKAV